MTADIQQCAAPLHDTGSAYRKYGCRCPAARAIESARKTKKEAPGARQARRERQPHSAQASLLIAYSDPGVPPFHADPTRACANLKNPDVMFPKYVGQAGPAIAVCRHCPFRQDCADWALKTGQVYGVWGGVTEQQRRRHIADRVAAGGAA